MQRQIADPEFEQELHRRASNTVGSNGREKNLQCTAWQFRFVVGRAKPINNLNNKNKIIIIKF